MTHQIEQLGPAPLGPDILSLVAQGHAADQAEHRAEASKKMGLYRAGNAGLASPEGEVTGSCHRVAWGRTVGAEEPEREGGRSSTKALMFGAGHSNEDLWLHDLRFFKESMGGTILREEEVPLQWERPNGQQLSGRPDMVLFDAKGKPVLGLELKLISSIGTALEVSIVGPKEEHLAQAMTYQMAASAKFGVKLPYQIWYTSRAVFANPGWSFLPKAPKEGEPGSEFHEYARSGKATKFPMNLVGFHLRLHDGRVYWQRVNGAIAGGGIDAAGRGSWVASPVTVEDMDRFWDMAHEVEGGILGPRPSGDFNKCDYCGFQSICDNLERDYPAWRAAMIKTGHT